MQRRNLSIQRRVWFIIAMIALVVTFLGLGWRVWAHVHEDDSEILKDFFLFPPTPSPQQIDTIWQEMMDDHDVRHALRTVVGHRLSQGRTDGARFKHTIFDLIPRIDWPTVVVTWSDLQSMNRTPDRIVVSSGSVAWSYVPYPEGDTVAIGPMPAFPGQICAVWEGVLGTAQRCQEITVDDVLQLFKDEVGENSASGVQRWHIETATGPRFTQLKINAPSAILRSDHGTTQVVRSGDMLGPFEIDGLEANRRLYVRFFAESPWGMISRAVSVADETMAAHNASSLSVHLPYLNDARLAALGDILARHLASLDKALQKQDVRMISYATPALREAYHLYVTESAEGLSHHSTPEHDDKDVMRSSFPSWRLEIQDAYVCYDEKRSLWQVEMRVRPRLPVGLASMLAVQKMPSVLHARLVHVAGQWLVDDLVQEETITTKQVSDPSIHCQLDGERLVDAFIPKASLTIPTWQTLIIGMDRPLVMFGEDAQAASLNLFLSKIEAYGTRVVIQDWAWPSLEKKLIDGTIDIALGVTAPEDVKDWTKRAEMLGQPAPVWVALDPEAREPTSQGRAFSSAPTSQRSSPASLSSSPLALMISGHNRAGLSHLLERFQALGYAVRFDDQGRTRILMNSNIILSSD